MSKFTARRELLKFTRNFWGKIPASEFKQMFGVFASYIRLKKILSTFQTIWKTSAKSVLLDEDVGGYLWGAKSVAPKMDFYFFRARSALLARAKFLRQPLVTYKTFGKNRFSRLFLICSKNTIVENGPDTPPTFVLDMGVLARI